jgi:hypothetical protein
LLSLLALVGTIVGFPPVRGDLWFFVIFWSWSLGWVWWFASRLKWVSVDESFVYVAGFRKEIRIPLSEVERVEESSMQRPKQITLRLKSPSEFGSKVVFVPRQRFFESIRKGHPLVDELRAMISAQNQSRG